MSLPEIEAEIETTRAFLIIRSSAATFSRTSKYVLPFLFREILMKKCSTFQHFYGQVEGGDKRFSCKLDWSGTGDVRAEKARKAIAFSEAKITRWKMRGEN